MIHTFIQNDLPIVLDVNSGAIHLVSPLVYQMVQDYPSMRVDDIFTKYKHSYPEEAILEGYAEIDTLVKQGALYTEPVIVEAVSHEPVIKAMCLHVAHDCNLACGYCFAEEGEYKGERSLMSLETGKRALDFLIDHSGSRVNLEVDFFGGEPLLNFDVVKNLVHYGREKEARHHKKFRFTMTTNATLLSEDMMDFLNREMSNIVLSMDGRASVHDALRPFSKGPGSYNVVSRKISRMIEKRGEQEYYVRGTFTRNNLDFSEDVKHMIELGYQNLSLEPVVSADKRFAIEEEHLDRLFKEYDALASYLLEIEKEDKDICFFHFMIDLEGGPCVYKRMAGCGAGTEYVAVSPEGNLYPCHQFVGQENFMLGNLQTGILEKHIVQTFSEADVTKKKLCQTCFAKYYCSGGCHANAYAFNHTILEPYSIGCQLQKKRIETAIMMETQRFLDKAISESFSHNHFYEEPMIR